MRRRQAQCLDGARLQPLPAGTLEEDEHDWRDRAQREQVEVPVALLHPRVLLHPLAALAEILAPVPLDLLTGKKLGRPASARTHGEAVVGWRRGAALFLAAHCAGPLRC